jgi:prepilin-type N-terminal cleavage/methylation domain-containing protein
MKKASKNNLNRGFTLIELIVSLTVASIVLLAIGTLMSVGTKSYYSTSTEIELQKESQIAINQINDLMIKAQAYELKDVVVSGISVPTLVITASQEGSLGNSELYYYAIIFDQVRNYLLFQKDSKSDVELEFSTDSLNSWLNNRVNKEITSPTPSLLAKYIKTLTVSPASSSGNTQGSVQITLELSLGGKDYSTFSTNSFRNK